MPRPPLIVIADDLTGAAEIAALAHRHGLTATVVTRDPAPGAATDLLVFDTDTRLDPAPVAAAKLSALAPTLAALGAPLVFKKTDSVLRGPVRAELEALARALGLARIFLVPANPTLGRTVRAGRYAINGTALHQSAFAHDPHHPATTDDVRALLGPVGTFALHSRAPQALLPATGLIVGDAASPADLGTWADLTRVPATLLAGGAEFFAALLRQRGLTEHSTPPTFAPVGPTLILSGTTHPGTAAARSTLAPLVSRPAAHSLNLESWADALQSHLATTGCALACLDGPVSSDSTLAPALRAAFAELARILAARRAFSHLIVEGGATAAAITRALDWHELRLHHAWSPGVASLHPTAAPHFILTLKPGSYPWPAALSNFSP